MRNERLRGAMVKAGTTVDAISDAVGVDPKTVERWMNGRIPHRRHRIATARHLGTDDVYLWPNADGDRDAMTIGRSELIDVFPNRASVPRETWLRLLCDARARIDVLVFSGTFFAQTQPKVANLLADRLTAGARVRLCFGAPDSEAVSIRDREEGIANTLGAKVRSALTYYRGLAASEGCEVRLHSTTLYASLFRYDDEMIINPHAYGSPATANPCLHVQRLPGGPLFDHYVESFERVWDAARPWRGEEV
jgi:hypothetical protein